METEGSFTKGNFYIHYIRLDVGRVCIRTDNSRNAFKMVSTLIIWKISFGRPMDKWENNIKMDLNRISVNKRY